MKLVEKKATGDYRDHSAGLIERLELKLTKGDEDDLCHWIDSHRNGIEVDRTRFLDRQQYYLYQWDDFVTFTREGPWENASNLHMPLTAIKVKTYLSKLYRIFTAEDTTQLVPRETTDDIHVEMVKLLRKWYLWDYLNGYKGIRGFAREAFYDAITVGYGIGLKDWQTTFRKVITIEPNEFAREMEDLRPQIEEAQEGQSFLQTNEELAETQVSPAPYREVLKVISVFEGTRIQSIPFENAFFPNIIPESSNLDYPPMVGVDTYMQMSDVSLKGQRGEWDKKKVKKIEDMGVMTDDGSYGNEIKEHRNRLSGIDDTNSTYDSNQRIIQYNFCSYDIDDDGINEELVVTKCRNVIVKVDFLDRISPSGMRPLFKFDCFTKPREAYSRGVVEYLYPLNEEMDQHHNMRIDYLSLQTCPFGVYRASSSLKSEPIQIAPGKFIPADEVTDMRVLNFPVDATALNAEEDRLWHYADMLTSSSSLNQGIVPERVGPSRSTSGMMTLLRQMDEEFVVTVDQMASQWKKMEKMILDDLDYRIDTAIKLRVLGASIPQAINAATPDISNKLLINAAFDMYIDVARAVTSEEIRKNDAEMILNKVAAPSVLQQMGIFGPKALYRAAGDWFRAFGKEPKNYIDEPEFIQKPLTLYQEIQICGQGELPPMSMQDDHEGKAQMLVAFTQSPEYMEAKSKGLYVANVDEMIGNAIKKHLTLAEMLKPKGLPNPRGLNEENMTEVAAGTAPQQGGRSPTATTGREKSAQEEEVKNESGAPEARV